MLTQLRAIAAHGFDPDVVIAREPLSDPIWRELISNVARQRLTGLAARAVADGALAVTEEQARELGEMEVSAAATVLLLERGLLETAEVLSSSSVPMRVLKGSAVAHLDYPDPALRHFGDIDLLLPGEQVDRGIAVLLAAGLTRPVAELAPGFDRRFGKGATLRRPDGAEVDVHRMLVAGSFGLRFHPANLFHTRQTFELGGSPLLALGRNERFLHACYHAALGNAVPRLLSVRDVAQMMGVPGFDWHGVLELARSWRGEAVLARAVRLCADVLHAPTEDELARWAEAFTPTARDRRAIQACLATEGRFARQSIGGLLDVRGTHAKLQYIAALALPRQSHLTQRGQDRTSHLVRAARRLRDQRRG